MTQINMTKCIRCNDEYAMEDDYGVCTSCQVDLEVELAIVSIFRELDVLENAAVDVVRKHQNLLEKCNQQLTRLVKNL